MKSPTNPPPDFWRRVRRAFRKNFFFTPALIFLLFLRNVWRLHSSGAQIEADDVKMMILLVELEKRYAFLAMVRSLNNFQVET